MSNRFKLKKQKVKEEDTEKNNDVKDSKHGAKFMKNPQEKGTKASNFAGKTSKEFSRKKT